MQIILKPLALAFLVFCAGLNACKTHEAQVDRDTLSKLLSCDISLAQAKDHALRAGYGIVSEDQNYFNTDYKKSDFESIGGFVTGEPIADLQRQFVVFSLGENKVSFRFKYRVFTYYDGSTHLENPRFTYSSLPIYLRIKDELCVSK